MIGWLAHFSYAAAAYSIEPHARVHQGRANEWTKGQRQPGRYSVRMFPGHILCLSGQHVAMSDCLLNKQADTLSPIAP